MAKVVACIIARSVSTRLPLKIFRDVVPGLSMLDFLLQRVRSVKEIDEVYLCTSTETVDDILEDIAIRNNVKLYRGSADAVIERMLDVAALEQADVLLRITGDNPFASIEFLPQQIKFLTEEKLDYVRVVDVPIGATIEVISVEALRHCYKTMDPSVSEYLMLFMFEPDNYKCGILKAFKEDYSNYSVTVDTPDDLLRTKKMLELLNKPAADILLKEILEIYTNEAVSLPAKSIQPGGTIKLPYSKTISFSDFTKDMDRRKQHSMILNLHE